MDHLTALKDQALATIATTASLEALEAVRQDYFGKKGHINALLKGLGSATPEERKTQGPLLNELKVSVMSTLEERKGVLETEALNAQLVREKIDVTLPGRGETDGCLHPISQTIEEVISIFSEMGFTVKEGPHMETDFHNFTALNIHEDHPARQEQDTFYVAAEEEGRPKVLRTHTSPVQIRTMLNEEPPIRIIAPGRTFRADYDMTHTPMFHQVEALYIDKNVNMGHLKGCLVKFLETFFGVENLPVRFRPSFFPFTEPSAEVDIGCARQDGTFKIGAGEDWLEILGCGMVNRKVLENCNLDPDEYQGFAFGMGIERIAMLKYGIPDLRTFFESDLRWLRHYGFRSLERPSPLNKVGGQG